ncbi:MAG: hypothetical protein AAFY73_09785 [Pseudomonadota bacterium]
MNEQQVSLLSILWGWFIAGPLLLLGLVKKLVDARGPRPGRRQTGSTDMAAQMQFDSAKSMPLPSVSAARPMAASGSAAKLSSAPVAPRTTFGQRR